MGDTNRIDSPLLMQAFQRPQARAPGDQVVDLVDLNVIVKVVERIPNLLRRFAIVRGPHFGSNHGAVSPAFECFSEYAFSVAVHRRRVKTIDASLQRHVDHASTLFHVRRRANVKGPPGTHCDHWNPETGAAHRSAFHQF